VSLAASDLMTLGSHTRTHPVLSALPPAVQRDEILGGKRDLEDVAGRRVQSFAYPYGRRTDYSDETVALVREAGFACACANVAGAVDASADGFELPRLEVRDWDGEEFGRRLSGWFDGRW
jgi:peptidoglycan/xylan/chitin deacetylase (PgdA/CDA1 family)